MFKHMLVITVSALLLAACATVPKPLEGDFPDVSPQQSDDRHIGQAMRWGGIVVDTRPGAEQTCVEILSRPLDRYGRPLRGDQQQGRFLACRPGFEDPAIFTSGREITVIGPLTGFVEGQIGEFAYVYPQLAADTLFLWNEPQPAPYYMDPYWRFDPWFGYWRLSGRIVIIR